MHGRAQPRDVFLKVSWTSYSGMIHELPVHRYVRSTGTVYLASSPLLILVQSYCSQLKLSGNVSIIARYKTFDTMPLLKRQWMTAGPQRASCNFDGSMSRMTRARGYPKPPESPELSFAKYLCTYVHDGVHDGKTPLSIEPKQKSGQSSLRRLLHPCSVIAQLIS